MLVLALGLVGLAPTLSFQMGLDQGVFAYMGAELLEGNWPYISTWDHSWPGLVVLHGLVISIFGHSVVAFRIFDLVWQLAVVFCLHRIGYHVANRAGVYLAIILYVLSYQSFGAWSTAQREGFGTLFILSGLVLSWKMGEKYPIVTAGIVGLGVGLAMTIKPTLLALVALYIPLLPTALNCPKIALKIVLAAGTGMVVPTLIFIVVYTGLGGLMDMYEATIAYQLNVYIGTGASDATLLERWIENAMRLGLTTKLLIIGYVPFLFFGSGRRKRFMLYSGFLGSVFAVWVQGTFAGYHYLPGMAIGALLVGSAYSQVCNLIQGERRVSIGSRVISVSMLGSLLMGVALLPVYIDRDAVVRLVTLRFLSPPASDALTISTVFSYGEDWQVARYLKTHTEKNEVIQVWGHESLVYYLAERDSASRFQTSNPLVMRPKDGDITPMQARWRTEFMEDINRTPPSYVVILTEDNWWWAPERKTSKQLLDEFPEWKSYISRNYLQVAKIGRLEIHRRKLREESEL